MLFKDLEKRQGIFTIPHSLLKEHPRAVSKFLSNFFIYHAESIFINRSMLVKRPSGVRHNVIGKRCRVLHDPCKPGKKVTAKLVIGVHIPMMINSLFDLK